jgi:GNAT superfamily N-acetyltransferase
MPVIQIESAIHGPSLDVARALFLEYVRAPDWEPGFAAYLAQQDFGAELVALPGAYARPGGCLLIARVDAEPGGCVAYKPLDPPHVCEMKRLYVRPATRERGVAERLVQRLLLSAWDAGDRRMRPHARHGRLEHARRARGGGEHSLHPAVGVGLAVPRRRAGVGEGRTLDAGEWRSFRHKALRTER